MMVVIALIEYCRQQQDSSCLCRLAVYNESTGGVATHLVATF